MLDINIKLFFIDLVFMTCVLFSVVCLTVLGFILFVRCVRLMIEEWEELKRVFKRKLRKRKRKRREGEDQG
jgi:hypothetical protein